MLEYYVTKIVGGEVKRVQMSKKVATIAELRKKNLG
jgi:hypothetical protein